ncbi:MAG: organic hydroperoxide resistance protein [Gammaproteobacteria bacterium]|nr:organic hydroperoxide resistance protein [Gammaproteobacteria bacterium]
MAEHTIEPLVTAVANSTGGRDGHAETTDRSVSVNLSVPRAMGGKGLPDTTTPEHLFACGYAACFGGAVDFVATKRKKDASDARVTCEVSVGPREGGGFGIAVAMAVDLPNLAQEDAEALVTEAHEQICPYSYATRGNIDIAFTVNGQALG